jgi:hypothetical protein
MFVYKRNYRVTTYSLVTKVEWNHSNKYIFFLFHYTMIFKNDVFITVSEIHSV